MRFSNQDHFSPSKTAHIKKPWGIMGSVALAHTEYISIVPKATECRVFCPATASAETIAPALLPETVYDIKYSARDESDPLLSARLKEGRRGENDEGEDLRSGKFPQAVSTVDIRNKSSVFGRSEER